MVFQLNMHCSRETLSIPSGPCDAHYGSMSHDHSIKAILEISTRLRLKSKYSQFNLDWEIAVSLPCEKARSLVQNLCE